MRLNISPIIVRELRSYMASPAVFVAIAAFLFMSGFMFYGSIVSYSDLSSSADYRRQMGFTTLNFTKHVIGQVFFAVSMLMIFIVPILTMRLIAEEQRTGTFEVLRSLPFTDWDIVLAKFFACCALVALILVINSYQILVMFFAGPAEMPVIAVAMLGAFLTAGACVSIGLFTSSITESQITAAIMSCVLLLTFWLIGDLSPASGGGFMQRLFEQLSMRIHSEPFTLGILRLDDVAYFLIVIFTFLFLTVRSLELSRSKI